MKPSLLMIGSKIIISILIISSSILSCKKKPDPIKYPKGFFPDSTIALSDINSAFDDFNMDIPMLHGDTSLIFSSNRNSNGEHFDLLQGMISFSFDQMNGSFMLNCEMMHNSFLTNQLSKANTDGDDFGPNRIFSPADGFDYLFLASENSSSNLDLFYLKNLPVFGSDIPSILGPLPATLLNTSADEAYICFDTNQDTAYFSSDRDGNFDIYLKNRPVNIPIDIWLNGEYSASAKVDSINSSADDKCPYVNRKIMVFASDRMGGMGGFDLYYSVFRNGKWSSPVNLGPDFNTSYNEYRPVIKSYPDFTNYFIIFSSDRPGGEGGYDLYFRGITLSN